MGLLLSFLPFLIPPPHAPPHTVSARGQKRQPHTCVRALGHWAVPQPPTMGTGNTAETRHLNSSRACPTLGALTGPWPRDDSAVVWLFFSFLSCEQAHWEIFLYCQQPHQQHRALWFHLMKNGCLSWLTLANCELNVCLISVTPLAYNTTLLFFN